MLVDAALKIPYSNDQHKVLKIQQNQYQARRVVSMRKFADIIGLRNEWLADLKAEAEFQLPAISEAKPR